MSTQQEVGVITVKYCCHKATRTLNVTQKSNLADAIVIPSGLKLYPDLCIAHDCFMILMLRSFQFNALSRGNQHPKLPCKKACQDIFGGFGLHQLLPESLPLCYWNLHHHFSYSNLYTISIYSETAVTSHLQLINQESYVYWTVNHCAS